jgi:hypothetical protein
MQLLQKAGYSGDMIGAHGLGATEQGRLEPVEAVGHHGRGGFGRVQLEAATDDLVGIDESEIKTVEETPVWCPEWSPDCRASFLAQLDQSLWMLEGTV